MASLCSDSSKPLYYAVVTKIIVRAVSTMNNSIKRQYPDFFKNKKKMKQNKQTNNKKIPTNKQKKQQMTERQKLITPFEKGKKSMTYVKRV